MKESQGRLSKLIGSLYADWLESLTENEFKEEVRGFDKRSGLISATNELLAIKKFMKEGKAA